MSTRQLIRHCDARKIAGQRATYSGLLGMKMMNRAGAYFFYRTRFGAMAILDDDSLSKDDREALAPYALPRFGVHIRDAALLLDEDFQIAAFVTPQDLAARQGGLRYYTRMRIWRFEHDAWALLHLLTGITTPTRSDREALAIYDEKFAPSAHECMRIRALVQDRKTHA